MEVAVVVVAAAVVVAVRGCCCSVGVVVLVDVVVILFQLFSIASFKIMQRKLKFMQYLSKTESKFSPSSPESQKASHGLEVRSHLNESGS